MGSPEENQVVPFDINYIGTPDEKPINDIIPHDPLVVPCYEALNVSTHPNYLYAVAHVLCNYT